jgi:hypothetical protein
LHSSISTLEAFLDMRHDRNTAIPDIDYSVRRVVITGATPVQALDVTGPFEPFSSVPGYPGRAWESGRSFGVANTLRIGIGEREAASRTGWAHRYAGDCRGAGIRARSLRRDIPGVALPLNRGLVSRGSMQTCGAVTLTRESGMHLRVAESLGANGGMHLPRCR